MEGYQILSPVGGIATFLLRCREGFGGVASRSYSLVPAWLGGVTTTAVHTMISITSQDAEAKYQNIEIAKSCENASCSLVAATNYANGNENMYVPRVKLAPHYAIAVCSSVGSFCYNGCLISSFGLPKSTKKNNCGPRRARIVTTYCCIFGPTYLQ